MLANLKEKLIMFTYMFRPFTQDFVEAPLAAITAFILLGYVPPHNPVLVLYGQFV